jgi:hypothetical protein
VNGRTLVFAAIAVAAAAAAAWWLTADAMLPVVPPAQRDAQPAAAIAPAADSGAPRPTLDGTRTAVERAAAPRGGGAADASGAAAEAEGVRVQGRLVLTDGTRDTTDADATMELACMRRESDGAARAQLTTHAVVVTGGAFTATLPGVPAVVSFSRIASGERRAVCLDDFPVDATARPLVVRARWQQSLTLRVVGADTGADLAGITVAHPRRHGPGDHPGADAYTVQHGRSPLRLEPRENTTVERFCVKAPGYAWTAVDLATTEAAERIVRLTPGGNLGIAVSGAVPAGAVVRVRGRGDDVPSAATPLRGAPLAEADAQRFVRVDGLPARVLAVSLEQGEWQREPVVLAHTVATVVAGGTADATLVVTGGTGAPPRVAVGGTLSLSPEWGRAVWLELEPMGPARAWQPRPVVVPLAAMTAVGATEHRWNAVELPAGPLGVFVGGCEHRTVVEVAPGPPTQLRVVVPDPNDVRVRVVDADTESPIAWPPGTGPGWSGLCDGWERGRSPVRMAADADGSFRFRAPAGRVEIDAHPEGYEWSITKHDVRPGRNDVVVRVARACGVEVVLTDGDSALPWPPHAKLELAHTTAGTGATWWAANRVAAKLPGEHTLTITGLADHEPVPPRVVTIERATWTKVEIVLVRKR